MKCPDRKGGFGGKRTDSSRSDTRKQTGGACIVGVCPKKSDDDSSSHSSASVYDDMQSVTLQCGHKLPVLSAGCTVGAHMPVCDG